MKEFLGYKNWNNGYLNSGEARNCGKDFWKCESKDHICQFMQGGYYREIIFKTILR